MSIEMESIVWPVVLKAYRNAAPGSPKLPDGRTPRARSMEVDWADVLDVPESPVAEA